MAARGATLGGYGAEASTGQRELRRRFIQTLLPQGGRLVPIASAP